MLFLLARQQFGGLTAITMETLSAFVAAQNVLSTNLAQKRIAKLGAHAFQAGVDAVVADSSITDSFLSLMPEDQRNASVIKLLLKKFFNQAGAEFVAQVHAIWASTEGATNGVAGRQELKVLQKKVAKSVEDRCHPLPPRPARTPPLSSTHPCVHACVHHACTQPSVLLGCQCYSALLTCPKIPALKPVPPPESPPVLPLCHAHPQIPRQVPAGEGLLNGTGAVAHAPEPDHLGG